jgi:reactive intermediate/imine deaminase
MQAKKKPIISHRAPKAIGTYSQAIRHENTVYLSGQIPLNAHNELVPGDFSVQLQQIFLNLSAVAEAAGGSLNDILKLTIYLTTMENYAHVNTVMAEFFSEPYPARAAVAVAALPKGVAVEIDAIMAVNAC